MPRCLLVAFLVLFCAATALAATRCSLQFTFYDGLGCNSANVLKSLPSTAYNNGCNALSGLPGSSFDLTCDGKSLVFYNSSTNCDTSTFNVELVDSVCKDDPEDNDSAYVVFGNSSCRLTSWISLLSSLIH